MKRISRTPPTTYRSQLTSFLPALTGGPCCPPLLQKRRVHGFVRLLDYMITTALHMLLVGSVSDLLAALTPTPPPADPEPHRSLGAMGGEEVDMIAIPLPAATKKAEWGGPMLQVKVSVHTGRGVVPKKVGAEPPNRLRWFSPIQTVQTIQTVQSPQNRFSVL